MSTEALFDLEPVKRKPEPLMKWAGGKRSIIKSLLPLIGKPFRMYFEPFVGGGALFFALQTNEAILGDKNEMLINCYIQVRDNPIDVIRTLSLMENSKENYYAVRASSPCDSIGDAARMLYLTTLAFNGIYRVNLKGHFNVPYGYKTYLQPCDEGKIYAVSSALRSTRLICGDFEQCVEKAQSGDLIYFDPPYTVAHNNNGFVKYNDTVFSWDDQRRLASVAKGLAVRGCQVIVSNADHPSIHELYRDFHVAIINRPSVVAASSQYRRVVSECVFLSRS